MPVNKTTPNKENLPGAGSLYNNQNRSDLDIKFAGNTVYAYQAILANKSSYFCKAFTGKFTEAQSSTISLKDDKEPSTVNAMIQHIYDTPYDNSDQASKETLLFQVNVFNTADKYDVPTLRTSVVTAVTTLLSSDYVCGQLSSAKAVELIKAIRFICPSSSPTMADESLSDVLTSFCAKNSQALVKHHKFGDVLKEDRPFAGDILVMTFFDPARVPEAMWECTRCSTFTIQGKLANHPCAIHKSHTVMRAGTCWPKWN